MQVGEYARASTKHSQLEMLRYSLSENQNGWLLQCWELEKRQAQAYLGRPLFSFNLTNAGRARDWLSRAST